MVRLSHARRSSRTRRVQSRRSRPGPPRAAWLAAADWEGGPSRGAPWLRPARMRRWRRCRRCRGRQRRRGARKLCCAPTEGTQRRRPSQWLVAAELLGARCVPRDRQDRARPPRPAAPRPKFAQNLHRTQRGLDCRSALVLLVGLVHRQVGGSSIPRTRCQRYSRRAQWSLLPVSKLESMCAATALGFQSVPLPTARARWRRAWRRRRRRRRRAPTGERFKRTTPGLNTRRET